MLAETAAAVQGAVRLRAAVRGHVPGLGGDGVDEAGPAGERVEAEKLRVLEGFDERRRETRSDHSEGLSRTLRAPGSAAAAKAATPCESGRVLATSGVT